MILRKLINVVSSLISWVYGFSILLIFDMINRKPYWNPVFRLPTNKGIPRGMVSIIIYFLFMLFFKKIIKDKDKRFIWVNCIAFVVGLILFCYPAVWFFVDTDTGP